MNTVNMKQFLLAGVDFNLPGFDLEAMPLPDRTDQSIWEFIAPESVMIWRWPRDALSAQGIILPDQAQEQKAAGWVIGVGPGCKRLALGDCVTFLPINYSVEDGLSSQLFPHSIVGGVKAYATDIGQAMEADLGQMTRTTRLPGATPACQVRCPGEGLVPLMSPLLYPQTTDPCQEQVRPVRGHPQDFQDLYDATTNPQKEAKE